MWNDRYQFNMWEMAPRFGGGSPPPATTQTKVQLTPEQKQLIGLAMPDLTKFANQGIPLTPFSTVSDFNPTQTQGASDILSSTGAQSGVVNNAAGASQFLTSGNALDPNTNPGLRGTIDAATRPIWQGLTESALPAIRGEAVGSGNYGGSRQGIAEGIATRGAEQAAGDTANKIAYSGYNTGLDSMIKALGLAPTTAQSLTTPGATETAVGDYQHQLEQAKLTEAGQRYLQPYTEPLQVGQALAGIAAGLPGAGTSTTSKAAPP